MFSILDENNQLIYKIIDTHSLKHVMWSQFFSEDMK